jgi:hypothetical protein
VCVGGRLLVGDHGQEKCAFARPLFRVSNDLCLNGTLDFDFAVVSAFGDFSFDFVRHIMGEVGGELFT